MRRILRKSGDRPVVPQVRAFNQDIAFFMRFVSNWLSPLHGGPVSLSIPDYPVPLPLLNRSNGCFVVRLSRSEYSADSVENSRADFGGSTRFSFCRFGFLSGPVLFDGLRFFG